MFNKKKQKYATVNTASRRPPGAPPSRRATETETNAGIAEEMNPQAELTESMEEVNTHLHEKPQEEEMGLGKDEASSQSKHVDCLSSDDESEQGGTGGIFPQLCLDADGNMIPDETSLFLVDTETTKKKNEIANTPVVVESHPRMIIPRNKGMKTAGHWSKEETDRLLLSLKIFGTDFLSIEMVFQNRNRTELKNKFKQLEKKNPRLLEEIKSDKRSLNELTQEAVRGTSIAPKTVETVSVLGTGIAPKTVQAKRKKKNELTGSKKIKGTATMVPLTTASAPNPSIATPSSRVVRKIEPRISNIVARVDLGTKVDLKKMVTNIFNTEWDPKQPARVSLRLPTSLANIFKSGTMMCFGAQSIKQAKRDTRKYASLVQRCGNAEVQYMNFKILTISAYATVSYGIKLEAMALKLRSCCRYTPEVTAGLKYKMTNPAITFNIFSTGKVLLTGGKTQDDVKRAFEKIWKVIEEFKEQ